MSNFYLLNKAVNVNDFSEFKNGMSELITIEREADDLFWKHDTLWNVPVIEKLFSQFGQEEQVISQFIEQLHTKAETIENEEQLEMHFPNEWNAFLGIDFSDTPIHPNKQVINSSSFLDFKQKLLNHLSFREIWSNREKLFPNLVLCGEVEDQLARIGDSSGLKQILEILKRFDMAVSNWETGDFSYHKIKKNYPLDISPESEQTLNKYGNQRHFKLPDGKTELFDLHIKTGLFRFHFYPDNKTKQVYIGYIGPHLSTVLYK